LNVRPNCQNQRNSDTIATTHRLNLLTKISKYLQENVRQLFASHSSKPRKRLRATVLHNLLLLRCLSRDNRQPPSIAAPYGQNHESDNKRILEQSHRICNSPHRFLYCGSGMLSVRTWIVCTTFVALDETVLVEKTGVVRVQLTYNREAVGKQLREQGVLQWIDSRVCIGDISHIIAAVPGDQHNMVGNTARMSFPRLEKGSPGSRPRECPQIEPATDVNRCIPPCLPC